MLENVTRIKNEITVNIGVENVILYFQITISLDIGQNER